MNEMLLKAHLVGSIPLPDARTVFTTVSDMLGAYVTRMPDGETGIRQSWIRFLQDALAAHPAIRVAADVPPFQFRQWDGTIVRQIPRLRVADPDALEPDPFASGYAEMAIESWQTFEALRQSGLIAPGIRFQVSIPSPIAPVYNNMLPADRPPVLDAVTRHFIAQVRQIAAAVPHGSLTIQWDVCQEVLALEGYYEAGPVDFRVETVETLARIGDSVPGDVELGYHLCYGSPQDEHIVQPVDAGIMVELINSVRRRLSRPIGYVHFPVPKPRKDDAYFEPFEDLKLDPGTDRYAGLIHFDDAAGDAARLATARRHLRVDGVATECGMGRGDPDRLTALLAAHAALIERARARQRTRITD